MKYIIAIIQPQKLEAVQQALEAAEVHLMTVTEVLGCGRQKGVSEVYRGITEAGSLRRKIKLEIGVNDNFVEPAIQAITKAAKTGEIGDGKIFVMDLKDCIRVRTLERGTSAIG